MINAALNLVPNAVGQGRPQIIGAIVADSTPQTPLPAAFTDPLFVVNPAQPESFWRVDEWTVDHGGTLPQAGAACGLFYDSKGALRALFWEGAYTAPAPGGAAGGDLSGSTFPNPVVSKIGGIALPLTGSAWVADTPINSWSIFSGFTVGHLKDPLGFVHMRGAVTGGTTGTVALVLPVGCRPGQQMNFINQAAGASPFTSAVDVYTNGNVQVFWATSNNASFDGITFLAEN